MTTFRRILVPHDFSSHADRALRVAAGLVRPGGELVLLHVVEPIMPMAEMPVTGLGYYISPEELAHGARRQLDRIVKRTFGRRGPKVRIEIAIGDPYLRIVEASRDADLVVVSTAGRTGLAHLIIGSVAEKIVRHSLAPVLTLRSEVARRLGSGRGRVRRRAPRPS